jgi:hypothetical protein
MGDSYWRREKKTDRQNKLKRNLGLEYDTMVRTRCSDGNVTAGYKRLAELKTVLSRLPEGVEDVSLLNNSFFCDVLRQVS